MLFAFFESMKYVGHLLPISFLRIFLGYYYLQSALEKFKGDFLSRPQFVAEIAESLPRLELPLWYKSLITNIVVPHWQGTAFVMTGLEFGIAISFLVGYVSRPMALIAALMSMSMMAVADAQHVELYRLLTAVHFALAWIGAGRCLGIDYYFYKRERGVWW